MPQSETVSGLVSTIIPVYNRAGMIHKAVNSVLEQTYRPIEIILVDDGSDDGVTPGILDLLASENASEIKVLHQENGGPGLAREAGRQVARGEFIQYLDSDDWILPAKFCTQVKALRTNPNCGIAYGITDLVDHRGNTIKSPSKRTGEIHKHLFPLLLTERWWHTSTPLYRRCLSDAAGAWPRQRPEDWDLEARMGAVGPELVWCDSLVSCHRQHDGAERVSRGSQLRYMRDEAWFLPRLYSCALYAGVAHSAPEMDHFCRWVFMRARSLGKVGETALANELMQLVSQIPSGCKNQVALVRGAVRALGWKLTSKLLSLYELLNRANDSQ